jgi:hypothetical protein
METNHTHNKAQTQPATARQEVSKPSIKSSSAIGGGSSSMATNSEIIVFLKQSASSSNPTGSVGPIDVESLDLITLLHPKGHPIVCCKIDNDLYELQSYNSYEIEGYGCWFINQRISSQQKFFSASKIDPRFLLLSHLEKNGSRYSPLDQIVTPTSAGARLPLENARFWKMDEFCDVNAKFEDMVFYRYNEEKVRQWLTTKVNKTAAVIMKQREARMSQSNSLISSTFNISRQSKSFNEPVADQSGEQLLTD